MTFAERTFWERIIEAHVRADCDIAAAAVYADIALTEWRKRWNEQSSKCLTRNCPGTITNDTCDTCSIVPAETLRSYAQYLRDVASADRDYGKAKPQESGTSEASATTQDRSKKEGL